MITGIHTKGYTRPIHLSSMHCHIFLAILMILKYLPLPIDWKVFLTSEREIIIA